MASGGCLTAVSSEPVAWEKRPSFQVFFSRDDAEQKPPVGWRTVVRCVISSLRGPPMTKPPDRKYLGRSSEIDDLELVRTAGNYVYDARGRRYLDFTSGWCVGNFGWGDRELQSELRRFKGPAYVPPSSLYAPWDELAALLAKITPENLTKTFRATGGSEAIDLALQAAMWHTKRGKFLSLEQSYHGNSIAGLSIGASEDRKGLPNFLRGCEKVMPPLNERALVGIERRLKRRDIAAFIMEPVAINLGVLVPERGAMTELQRLCRRFGTLLIMDEVACGIGRTGTLFASEHFEIEPDILCLAKALTGGHAAIGATIMTTNVARSMEAKGSFYSTYGWHPYSVHAALVILRHAWQQRQRLLQHVAAMSDLFRERLGRIAFEGLRALRIHGLAIGLEFEQGKKVSRLEDDCQNEGLLLTDAGDEILLLLPPMTIDPDVANRGLKIIERVVNARKRTR
jgi:acetylornithine/succinyldiaminopimelate/putrescine aminotransferase